MDAKVSTKTKTKTFQNLDKKCPLAFSPEFKKFFLITKTFFSKSEQFW